MTQGTGQSTHGANLSLQGTASTPSVEGDWQAGRLRLAGESYPENTYEIFDEIITWLEAFLDSTDFPLTVELHLNYLNTSSVRGMIDIFDRLQSAYDAGRVLVVHWLYDSRNPRSAEMGEEFKEDYTFQFEIQSVSC